jgi:hypothetical protein
MRAPTQVPALTQRPAIIDAHTEQKKSGPPVLLWVGLAAVLVIGIVAAVVMMGGGKPARELSYSLTVQKWRGGDSFGEPFKLAQEMLFGPHDKLRLTFASPQSGHLYIINEGPDPKTGQVTYNLLFPKPTTPASVSPNQEVNIPPDPHWISFDEAQGTEKLWLTFAVKEIPELEAAKSQASAQGVVSDSGQIAALKAFFGKHEGTPAQVVRDEALKRTLLTTQGDALVHLVKLEHQ